MTVFLSSLQRLGKDCFFRCPIFNNNNKQQRQHKAYKKEGNMAHSEEQNKFIEIVSKETHTPEVHFFF